MPISVNDLLRDTALRLRVINPPTDSAALHAPLTWAHSSDLPDPTPWLEEGQLLLTDGDFFLRASSVADARVYVQRLQRRSVRALGFATGILHEAVPERLAQACRESDLILIEVADRTPFMAIIRRVADAIADDRRERLEWSIAAHRSIARAALRSDGRAEILRELSRQLGCWVALFDASGALLPIESDRPMPPHLHPDVAAAVAVALDRGTRSGARLSLHDDDVTLQTLGSQGDLRGVLAVGTGALHDSAENDLMRSVIALASIAVEQSRSVEHAEAAVRTSVLELLLTGSVDAARRSLAPIGGRLPDRDVRVVVVEPGMGFQRLRSELLAAADRDGLSVFLADRDGRLVVILDEAALQSVVTITALYQLHVGGSAPVTITDISEGLAQAIAAGGQSRNGHLLLFDAMAGDGLLGLMHREGGVEVAAHLLRPLRERSTAERAVLVDAARVWLEHNSAWDPAARALGIHRHTLRTRIDDLGTLLGLDFTKFGDRVELWSALRLQEIADRRP